MALSYDTWLYAKSDQYLAEMEESRIDELLSALTPGETVVWSNQKGLPDGAVILLLEKYSEAGWNVKFQRYDRRLALYFDTKQGGKDGPVGKELAGKEKEHKD